MKNYIVYIAIVLAILVLYCSYRCMSGHRVKVKYYYSPGCPHCRNFMPAWSQFASKASGKADIQEVNCATNPSMCAGIRGVPHVVFSTDKSEVVYPGDRTTDGLYSFLERFSS